MIIKKKGNRVIVDHEQLVLEELIGKREVRDFTVDDKNIENMATIFSECLAEFEVGDIVRLTIERIGREIDEDNGECQEGTGEEVSTQGS